MFVRVVLFFTLFSWLICCNTTTPSQQDLSDKIGKDSPRSEFIDMGENRSLVLKLAPRPKVGEVEHDCLAEIFSFLIGQPKSAIAAIEYPYNTRLFYLDEEKSDVFVANRLNLILDSSDKIIQVYCG